MLNMRVIYILLYQNKICIENLLLLYKNNKQNRRNEPKKKKKRNPLKSVGNTMQRGNPGRTL